MDEIDYYRLGNAALGQGDFEKARLYYKLAPEIKGAVWNLSQIDLLEGHYDRWPDASLVPNADGFDGTWRELPPLPGRAWDGSPVDELTVIADQGAGDTLIFARYLREAKKRVGKLTVSCHPSLARLLAAQPGVDAVGEPGEVVTTFMRLPPLLSNPVCVTGEPYLTVPEDPKVTEVVKSFGDGPRVGVCWTGNPSHPTNPARSFPREAFYDLPVKPYSLQHGHFDPNFRNVGLMFTDFLSTAQVVAQMDLVITCSTSVSVIAPALGVETWVLLDTLPYWLWGLRDTTDWFGTARLFRQGERGEWQPVLLEVRESLASWTARR